MTDLIEFLRARLDDDERIAQAALGLRRIPSKWWTAENLRGFSNGPVLHALSIQDAQFIATQSPTRALREVAAKRRLLSAHDVHCVGFHTYDSAVWQSARGGARLRTVVRDRIRRRRLR